MFIKNLILLLGLLITVNTATAQKKLKNGRIDYQVTEIKSEKPGATMLQGMEMNLYFKGDMHKLEISTMGGMINMATITDLAATTHVTMVNMMGRKMKVSADTLPKTRPTTDYTVTYERDNIKKIADYPCYKAIMKSTDGVTMTAYVTNKIKARHPYFVQLFSGLEGWPMEYTIENNGMKMTFTAQAVSRDIDTDGIFVVPNDYEEKTPEEFKAAMGGINLGF